MKAQTVFYKVSTAVQFTVSMSLEEVKAVKHLIGKTSQQDRVLLGLSTKEAMECGEVYKDLSAILQRVGEE